MESHQGSLYFVSTIKCILLRVQSRFNLSFSTSSAWASGPTHSLFLEATRIDLHSFDSNIRLQRPSFPSNFRTTSNKMALIITLGAIAAFVPTTFAQSSASLNAFSENTTPTGVLHPLSNTTLSCDPTATPARSGFITSYVDISATGSSAVASSSLVPSSIVSPASTLESAEKPYGQPTVIETAPQTVTVTATPTKYLTHTVINANATGLL